MKILAISDLHGYLPNLPEVDVVCIVGDIVPSKCDGDIEAQWHWYNEEYLPWVDNLKSRFVITVAGNHDKFFSKYRPITSERHIHLENSRVVIDGCYFYGTPNTSKLNSDLSFKPYNKELAEIFGRIPPKVDFLLAHSAPYDANGCGFDAPSGLDIGSRELADVIYHRDISYLFCGHIHTGNHSLEEWHGIKIANVAYTTDGKPSYAPLLVEWNNQPKPTSDLREV